MTTSWMWVYWTLKFIVSVPSGSYVLNLEITEKELSLEAVVEKGLSLVEECNGPLAAFILVEVKNDSGEVVWEGK